jgi:hypothetical protein
MFKFIMFVWAGILVLGTLSLVGQTAPEGPNAPARTATVSKQLDAGTTTANEERGCALAADVTWHPRPSRVECQGMVAASKKFDDVASCVLAMLLLRTSKEPVSTRPAGIALVAFKGCAMMMKGSSEEITDTVIQKTICANSHDPQTISECRGGGYRN